MRRSPRLDNPRDHFAPSARSDEMTREWREGSGAETIQPSRCLGKPHRRELETACAALPSKPPDRGHRGLSAEADGSRIELQPGPELEKKASRPQLRRQRMKTRSDGDQARVSPECKA